MLSVSEKAQETNSEVCCPLFKAELWNDVKQSWNEKLFLKDSVPEIFHIPLPGTYAKAIDRMWKKASGAGAAPEKEDFLLLAHDPSPFKGELYMAITKDIPGEPTVKLSGDFFSKVFEATYNEVSKCLQEMNVSLASKKMISKKDYIYFPYCPKCAKKYGHNYVVVLSKVVPL